MPSQSTHSRLSRLATGGGLFLIGAAFTALALGALTPRVDAAGPATAAAPLPSVATVAVERPVSHVTGLRTSYADALAPAMRAVVNIQSTHKVHAQQQVPDFFPWHFQVPGQEPGGDQPQDFDSESLGSGVIVRSDGVILTNNHVVEDADEVTVTLADKRELRAKVIGTDPATDIAVIKVEQNELPTLPLGQSGDLRVGDVVFAIGSPFGLSQTATMGIVSAVGRSNLGITHNGAGTSAGYENFIQTDAAINIGNSGGALVDADGELVGINTAIYSRGSSGNQGIGFAVPVDLARPVMEQIVSGGHVVRSLLGVTLKPIDAPLARSFGLPRPEGALVMTVKDDSPADKAGIKPDDVILELDGKPVEDRDSLRLDIAGRKPGTRVEVGVQRDVDGKAQRLTLPATLEELKEDEVAEGSGGGVTVEEKDNALRGIRVDDVDSLSTQERQHLNLDKLTTGALVMDVAPGTPASRAGLQPGAVITELNHDPVTDAASFRKLAKTAGKDVVRVKMQRRGQTDIIALEP